MLSTVGLFIPDIVHELIIDPRNDAEHEYIMPTREQAKRAVEIADLFIRATKEEREQFAIVSIGWSISVLSQRSCAPGNEYERLEFTGPSEPMLLIDDFAAEPDVVVLYPGKGEVIACRLRDFKRDETIELAKLLRQQRESPPQSGFTRISHDRWIARPDPPSRPSHWHRRSNRAQI